MRFPIAWRTDLRRGGNLAALAGLNSGRLKRFAIPKALPASDQPNDGRYLPPATAAAIGWRNVGFGEELVKPVIAHLRSSSPDPHPRGGVRAGIG